MEYSHEWKESQTPHLSNNGKIVFCKCDKFVLIVVPGRSSEAHLTSSAEDSAESTKELTTNEQETTQASRDRLQDLTEQWWNQDQHLLEVTAEIFQNHFVRNLSHPKHNLFPRFPQQL